MAAARKQDRKRLTNKPTTVYLPEDDLAWLAKHAKWLAVNDPHRPLPKVALVIRRIVGEYRKKHENEIL
jgi:hypothetical protein